MVIEAHTRLAGLKSRVEESPENERLRRQRAMQSARFMAERPRYLIPARDKEMRQPEDWRARRGARRAQIARENEAVRDWLRRKNFEDEYRAHHVADVAEPERRAEPTESFDWQWVDRRIEARLREERAYFDDALADHARTTNEVMAGIVRALDNVARSAKSGGDLATLTGAIQKLSETVAGNQRAILRAIRRASQSDGVATSEPSHHPKENARVH
jgi:hypothetical protein